MEEERPDIKIDGSVATWEMKTEGEILGTYMGTFKFRCYLTPSQTIAAGREERQLLGTNVALAPEHERFLAFALTQLKYRVVSAPPFWASAKAENIEGDLPDEEVLVKILNAAIESEKKYKAELKKRKDTALERAKAAGEFLVKQKKEESEVDEDEDDEEK